MSLTCSINRKTMQGMSNGNGSAAFACGVSCLFDQKPSLIIKMIDGVLRFFFGELFAVLAD